MSAVLTVWFDGTKYHPPLPGRYEVRNRRKLSQRNQNALIGRFRFWDGSRWFPWEGAPCVSVFSDHPSHAWRGLAFAPSSEAQ